MKKRDPLRGFAEQLSALPSCRNCGMPVHPAEVILILTDLEYAASNKIPEGMSADIPIEPRAPESGLFCDVRCVNEYWDSIGFHDPEPLDEEDWEE